MAQAAQAVTLRLRKRATCPHCWHHFSPAEILWIAQHSDLIGDARLGADHPQRFLPSRFNPAGEAIDSRGFPCHGLACPRCHLELPRAIIELPALFWSILGAPACGKSYFLASMTWQLRQVLPQRFALNFSDVDPAFNRVVNEYEDAIFLADQPHNIVAIRKTELQGELYDTVLFGDQSVSYPRPFLFRISPSDRHPNAAEAKRLSRVLCMYDNAGEHFLPGQDTTASPVTRHLIESRALFFLFDPLQDPRFRRLCAGKVQDPQVDAMARTNRQVALLQEAEARIRRLAGLRQSEKYDRELIVVVTKYDAWRFLSDFKELRPSWVRGADENWCGLDVNYIEQVSGSVRELLNRHCPEIVASAEGFSDKVVYVPVSATGVSPEVDERSGMLGVRPEKVRPMWVEVPVLYSLYRWSSGLVPHWDGKAAEPKR